MQSTSAEHNETGDPDTRASKPRRLRWRWIILLGLLLAVTVWGFPLARNALEARKRISQVEEENSGPGAENIKKPTRDDSKPVHPLDPALEIAYRSLKEIQANVTDYTTTIVSRERVSGKMGEPKTMQVRIRNRKVVNEELRVPFSVYIKFLQPKKVNGREVIWVECHNDDKMVLHEPGFKNFIRIKLKPTGLLAMMESRYPITEIGIEKIAAKLIQKGERDRQHGDCEVEFDKNAEVDGVRCTLIRVKHPVKKEYFDFHIAEIYVDEKRLVPLRYCAYDWPEKEGEPGLLMEEYIYQDLKLNVGLQDKDFDPDNEEYDFP